MKEVSSMYTVEEVNARIAQIGRYDDGLEERARSRVWSPAERTANPKLDRMLTALARRDELTAEISDQLREPSGELIIGAV